MRQDAAQRTACDGKTRVRVEGQDRCVSGDARDGKGLAQIPLNVQLRPQVAPSPFHKARGPSFLCGRRRTGIMHKSGLVLGQPKLVTQTNPTPLSSAGCFR